jgi:Protein of unknown function (DUF3311)
LWHTVRPHGQSPLPERPAPPFVTVDAQARRGESQPPITFSLLTSHILVHGLAMGSEDEPDHSDQDGITIGSIVVAAIPFLALVLGPFLANRLEPRIFGLPFLLAYCVFWVLLTPVFLFWVDRLRKRR